MSEPEHDIHKQGAAYGNGFKAGVRWAGTCYAEAINLLTDELRLIQRVLRDAITGPKVHHLEMTIDAVLDITDKIDEVIRRSIRMRPPG
jgi:hypothetical protein